jgi:hypothetical protein
MIIEGIRKSICFFRCHSLPLPSWCQLHFISSFQLAIYGGNASYKSAPSSAQLFKISTVDVVDILK